MQNQIKFTTVCGTIISTIKLANVYGKGYETCVFFKSGKSKVVKKYLTKQEAERGHDCIVKMLGGI